MKSRILAIVLGCSAAASAQVVNGGFETGLFAPWMVTPTPFGTSITTSISTYDIDGPGPLAPSPAASFMVGRTAISVNPEGIVLSQSVPLVGGTSYALSFNWSVNPLVNVYNASGGIFELLVDGAVLAQAIAPVTVANQRTYGRAFARYSTPQSGNHTLAIRIRRNIPAGEEVFQLVDNVAAVCYANCDGSTVSPTLTANDFQCFLDRYVSGDAYANCDGSTTSPVLSANDFQCFINTFAGGCP